VNGHPLRLTGNPAVWAGLYAATGVLYLATPILGFGITPSTVALLFTAVPALILLGALYALDSTRREPTAVRTWALLWGGLIAVTIAGSVNSVVSYIGGEAAAALISAPVIEELAKWAGLLFLVRWGRLRTPMEGVLLGAYIGAGFAISEDLFYFGDALLSDLNGESTDALTGTFFARTLTPFGHSFFTMIAGAGLGLYMRRKGRTWPISTLVAAMLLHALWNLGAFTENAVLLLGAFLPVQLLSIGAVLLLVIRERRRIRRNLERISPLERALIEYRHRRPANRTEKLAHQILRREALRRALEPEPAHWTETPPHPAGAAHLYEPRRTGPEAPVTP
jgi:RsiW-degrading membrane proteinase PrsW (M82 family)